MAFIDSAPCQVFDTLLVGAQQIVGSKGLAETALAALASVAPVKAPEMGPPPFKYDPMKLLMNVDLSGRRKIFFLHVKDDLVVPTSNFYACINATMVSILKNDYPRENMQSYLGEIVYPYSLTNHTRQYCNNHIAFQFNQLTKFQDLLLTFFSNL